jgi:hypothetical protein
MKQFKFTINGNNYDVDVQCIEGNIADIEVNGTPYKVEIHREVKKVATPKLVREKIPTKKSDSKIKKAEQCRIEKLSATSWKYP